MGGQNLEVINITATQGRGIPLKQRKTIVISARVHPCEAVSSHIMNGTIQFLALSDSKTAHYLR